MIVVFDHTEDSETHYATMGRASVVVIVNNHERVFEVRKNRWGKCHKDVPIRLLLDFLAFPNGNPVLRWEASNEG